MPKSSESAARISEPRALVRHAFALAREIGVTKLLVHAHSLRDVNDVAAAREVEEVVWFAAQSLEIALDDEAQANLIRVPDSTQPMNQLQMALLLAVVRGDLSFSETVVSVFSIAAGPRLDTAWVTSPKRAFPWFGEQHLQRARDLVALQIFVRVVEIALRFAVEGREGARIGTIFVLGEPEQLDPHVRQLILNPCKGHARRLRNVNNPAFLETLREFSALDGAFVIDRSGVVEAAGVYIDAPMRRIKLAPGLGARHAAAAAITRAADAIAVVLSQSSGTITVYHRGRALLDLDPLRRPATES